MSDQERNFISAEELDSEDYRSFFDRAASDAHLLFCNPDFLNYREPSPVKFVGFRRRGHIFAASGYWTKSAADGSGVMTIPASASFGGIVSLSPLRLADYSELLPAMVEFGRSHGCSAVEWIPPSRHHLVDGDDEPEFAALSFGFERQVVGLESVVSLPAIPDSKCRNLLKKCDAQGVTYRRGISPDTFYALLDKTYERHQAKPTHSLEELERLYTRLPDRIRFVGASLDEQVIAAACIFRILPSCDFVFYLCTDAQFKQHNPLMRLLQSDMDAAFIEGVRMYNFGTSSVGLTMRNSVWNFKKQFGARGQIRSKYVSRLV